MIGYIILILLIATFLSLIVRKDILPIGAIIIAFFFLVFLALGPEIVVFKFGGWEPPFGIVWAADKLSLMIALLVTGIASLVAVYSLRYIKERRHRYYSLLSLMTIGMLGVSMTGDIFNLYVFFEIFSISSYALVAFFLDDHAIEGAFKYLVVGSFTTSFLLLGIALLYGSAGTLNMADLSTQIVQAPMFLIPLALLITGFGLKIAMVPFHFWKPDAVEGTPSPIGAIFTAVSTAVGIYCIMRVLFIFSLIDFNAILIIFGIVSMVVGAVMAFMQDNVKRLLAYSSISQVGYILLALGLGTYLGISGGLYQLLNNALANTLLFLSIGVVILYTGRERLSDISIRSNILMVCFGIGALSVIGMPPLNGYVSKYMIYLATWEVSPVLTAISIIVTVFTLAYYLKAFSCIFLNAGKETEIKGIPLIMLVPIIILAVLCIILGILPHLGLYIVEPAAQALTNSSGYVAAVLGGG